MPDAHPQGGSGRTVERSHEVQDMRIGLVIAFGLALTATLVGSHYGLRAVFKAYSSSADRRDRPRPPLQPERTRPPEPRLQENPVEALDALQREEDLRLGTYGWVDRQKKILRIPIERAMDLVIQKGIPARAPAKGAD